jgi:class 3 adenylate cyclase
VAASGGQARVETVTVLFTDLVDSTGRRVRSGEEAADRLRQHHDRLLRASILGHGGTVAKHTGDGVMASFAGASDAIAAAVAIQQAIESDNRKRGDEPLAVRIGISVGDVSVEDGDVFGLPVVEAQRLEAAAGGGEIFISALVKAMARGRGGHEYEGLGELELKGLDGPLEAVRVHWSPVAADTPVIVRPPALAQHGGFAFAGRAKERTALDDAWKETVAGACRLVFLAGEPGIGKTRLASEFATDVATLGGVLLAGRCDEMVSEPYQPFAEALRFQLTQPDGALSLGDTPEELVRLAPDLAMLHPELGSALASTPDAERIRFFEAVRSWLAQVGSHSPLLLVLDDVHWADAGSLLLLRHVVATDPVPGLLVLVTYRDTDLDRMHPLSAMLSDFHRRADAVRIALKGLAEDDVAEFVTLASGHALDDDARRLVAALSEETGGNPFFAGEVLRHLVESGALFQRDGRWISESLTEGDLPEGVREVVGRRLSALPEDTQQLLTAASVIGARFDLDLLVIAAKSDDDSVLDALEPAISAQLVAETGFGRFQFAHALIRSTLHQELSTTRRARLHRAVAQAILQLNESDLEPVVADLAYHFGEAGAAASSEEALVYARRAAELALDRLAPDEAIRWSRAALDLVDDDEPKSRAELLGLLARAETLTGALSAEAAQDRAARAALDVGDVSAAIEYLAMSTRLVTTIDRPAMPERMALLEEALERIGDSNVDQRARLLGPLAFAATFAGDLDRREAISAEVEELAPQVGHAAMPMVLVSMFMHSFSNRSRAKAADLIDRWRAWFAEPHEDPPIDRIRACSFISHCAVVLGDGEARRRYLALKRQLLAEHPDPFAQDALLLLTIQNGLIDRDPNEVERLVQEFAAASTRHGRPDEAALYATVGTVGVAWERDGLEAVVDLAWATANGPNPTPAAWSVAVAAAIHAGRRDDAAAAIDEQLARGLPDVIDDASWPFAIAYWTDAAASLRHVAASREIFTRLKPLDGLHLSTGGFYGGSVALHLGRLASVLELPETVGWFEQALAEHVAIDGVPWIARTHLNWAEHLAFVGDAAGAREHASRALDIIGDGDYRVTARRARALLATS